MKKVFALVAFALCVIPQISHAEEQLHQRVRYKLHAGDVIALDYRYTPEFNQTVTIQPDGYVTLNVVGAIKVAGLTVDEAHDQIVSQASSRLNKPELGITLKDFQHPY